MTICGRCELQYETKQEYLEHTCEVTGYKPTEPEHYGKHYHLIQEKALERGAAQED